MPWRIVAVVAVLLGGGLLVRAAEPSLEGKLILLTRAGVRLEAPEGEKIAPKTAGLARDLTFHVLKDKDGRLRIDSRRQEGWIARSDAVLFDQAVAYFTEQISRNPRDSYAFTARGVALASSNDADKSVADFTRAIELDPKAILAYYHRANHEYGKKQYDQALEDYNAVIQIDPAFDWAYHVRGWIYYRKKDYDKALADYETALKLVPTETVFYRDRGNIELVRKEYDKASDDYSRSIELDPKYATPRLQRGKTWAAKKEYEKALADFEKTVELASSDSFASPYYVALALFRAGCPEAKFRDGKKALEAAQKAYELTKGPAEQAALAAAHAELGEFDKAVEWQTKALAAATGEEKEQQSQRLKLYQEQKPYRFENYPGN
jgi:tetratricopeptide (TPR) repeat protein